MRRNSIIEARFPFRGRNTTWNVSDNLSKVWRTHTLKAGFHLERTRRDASRASQFNGTISFNRSTTANFDTNYAYSNAVLGSITSYTEADAHPQAYSRFRNVEWFAQDNWRVNRRLTLDVGVRFYKIVPNWVVRPTTRIFCPGRLPPGERSASDPALPCHPDGGARGLTTR